jgi:DNA-directed RNA polymerase I subunit RPA1
VHSFNELYGYKLTGQLMTCLTKLFSSYLQVHGFTCGMDDLILQKSAEKSRKTKIEHVHTKTVEEVAKHLGIKEKFDDIDFVGRESYLCDENGDYMKEESAARPNLTEDSELTTALRIKYITESQSVVELDEEFKHHLYEGAESIIEDSLKGFVKRFPQNNFSMMTVTGAKGSNINHSQVSVMLGQQELEGKRVPMMISKKTLPCFIPCDPNPRAYGFISDRFLTGLREQEFFFHCMAGREGLIDTAVKTSRSGYLQRCLMKHLESLKVEYDYTVRDADGGIVQFYYGEDSIDPTRQKFLEKFDFLRENESSFKKKYDLEHFKDILKTA